jgi:hypothetical protein
MVIVNSIVKNGFFNFIISSDNARIKVLRNMRAHDNIIFDKQTWDANLKRIIPGLNGIIPGLNEEYTMAQITALELEICTSKKILLYDMNDKEELKFMIIEEPTAFLKILITLCHIQMFILGLNTKMIISREVFKEYWLVKYPGILNESMKKEMDLQEHPSL